MSQIRELLGLDTPAPGDLQAASAYLDRIKSVLGSNTRLDLPKSVQANLFRLRRLWQTRVDGTGWVARGRPRVNPLDPGTVVDDVSRSIMEKFK